ncbi:MAG: M20/M25/M40 family metallo-hydrolase [Thermoleophilia bacterium]
MPVLDAIVRDLVELASIPAPTGDEGARLAWLERRLASAAGTRERDAAGSLVWRGAPGRPAVAVLAHVDTVFPADVPHAPRRDGDALVGPGVGDNAAAVAVCVHVVEELLAADPGLPLAAVCTVGEEGLGNLRGAREAVRSLRPDAVIALEGHGIEQVLVDAVGSVRARVVARGPGGHSWADRGRPSAIHALLELGAALVRLGDREAPVNVGSIAGGGAVNAIAESAELVVERRALDEPPLVSFLAELERLAAAAPLDVAVEVVGRREAGRLPRDARLLRVVEAARGELGLELVLGAGSTDANAAIAAGIPAVTLGVTSGTGMHTPGERIRVEPLALGARQLALVLRRLLADG